MSGARTARRLTRPWGTLVLLLLTLAGLVGAFFLGRLVGSPEQRAAQSAPETVQAYAVVEQRQVSTAGQVIGELKGGQQHPLVTAPAAGVSDVVTSVALTPGAEVRPLTHLGTTGGTPYFAIGAQVPLYRDLRAKDSGPDVLALQKELAAHGYPGVTASGTVDAVTLEAVQLVYAAAGLTAPTEKTSTEKTSTEKTATVFRHESFVKLPVASGTVVKTAAVASKVSAENPLVVVGSGKRTITAQVTVPLADQVSAGGTVTLSSGTLREKASILSVGEFAEGKDGVFGRLVTIDPPEGLTAQTGAPVQITIASAAPKGPAVPLIALREENGQPYVLAAPSRAAEPRRVDVRVTAQADGWAAVAPVGDGRLTTGDVLWLP